MVSDILQPIAHLGGVRPNAPNWFSDAIQSESEEGQVQVSGANIRFSAWGEVGAPGLLFVHGGRAHRNWWRPFAPFFAHDFRVAALDLSGLGDSDWREHYDVGLNIQEILAVCEAAKLNVSGLPLILGHSFGGWIALSAVERAGEQLAGAIIVDAPITAPESDGGYDLSKLPKFVDKKKLGNRVYDTINEPISRFRFVPQQPGEELYLIDYIARQGLKKEGLGWTWKFDPTFSANVEFRYEQDLFVAPRCPLAFIFGEQSAMARGEGFDHIKEIAADRFPFILVPGAHHHLMIDSPLEFVSVLRSLLKQWPAQSCL